jgi:hypothetical protein
VIKGKKWPKKVLYVHVLMAMYGMVITAMPFLQEALQWI